MEKLIGAYDKLSADNNKEEEEKMVLPVSQIIGSMEQANRYICGWNIFLKSHINWKLFQLQYISIAKYFYSKIF